MRRKVLRGRRGGGRNGLFYPTGEALADLRGPEGGRVADYSVPGRCL